MISGLGLHLNELVDTQYSDDLVQAFPAGI